MPLSQLAATKPSNGRLPRCKEMNRADGVVDKAAGISFETKVARGFGHIRSKGRPDPGPPTTMDE